MRTYYHGRDALVTDDFFVWFTSPSREFAIRDLRNVTIVRGDVAFWRRRYAWELHAWYQDRRVVLYASFDETVFNQVTRALRRATENNQPPSAGSNGNGVAA